MGKIASIVNPPSVSLDRKASSDCGGPCPAQDTRSDSRSYAFAHVKAVSKAGSSALSTPYCAITVPYHKSTTITV